MKIKELIAKFPQNARAIKELVKWKYGVSFEWIILNENFVLDSEFLVIFEKFASGYPLEYITNKASFYGLDFYVKDGVLVPRTETEILIDKILELNLQDPKICEIGFGSGIVSIVLKKLIPNAQITATDISQIALEVASKNASKFGVCVDFVISNLLDKVSGNFDLIVSNPPYIANGYKLDKWVLSEPKEALFGGECGDEILKKIIEISSSRCEFLACEMGYDQKKSMQETLSKFGFEARFYKDYSDFDRGFVARRKI